ncbi:MAG: CotH kinase family protein [Flavobacteriales bacterium]|nr:CotH kinase family protein [Flavobacteriales bacterium]
MHKHLLLLLISFFLASGFHSQTFNSTVDQWIPDDGSTVYHTIDVSGLADVINGDFGLVQVCLNLDHTYDADMEVKLSAPDGTIFTLFAGIGGGDDNWEDCCLRDDAADFIYNSWPPYTGTFKPMGNMGNVNNGQNPNGTWALVLYDNYAWADQGYLFDWSISFDVNAPEPFVFPGSTLPVVKISTFGIEIPNDPKVEALFELVNHDDGSLNFYTDTVYEYAGNVLIELQGFTGPYYPKKNYDFDVIDDLGNKIDTSLLDMPAENDWMLKAEYLDGTLMYNSIAYEFSRRMGQYAPRTKFCEVFVDGDYVGVYTLTEKVKRDNNRVDIAKLNPEDIAGTELTGGYIIEMNINGAPGNWNSEYEAINVGTNGLPVEFKHVYPKATDIDPIQHGYIKAWVDSFEYALHQPDFDDPFGGYRKWIDEDSFIDFMLVNEFSTNYDSYGRSTYLFKDKSTSDDSLMHIGPPWDYDRGFCCAENWVWEETHPGWPFPDWWEIFHTDSLFLEHEWCRWTSLREDIFSTENFMGFVDSLHTLLDGIAERNYERWPELGVWNWDGNVEYLQTLLTDRLEWMDNNITGNYNCIDVLTNTAPNLESFEDDQFPPNCWSLIDDDGDEENWKISGAVPGFGSENCAHSYSVSSLTPDNYLITPLLHPMTDEHLTYYVAGQADGFEDTYQVLLSTSGDSPTDFTVVLWEETISGNQWHYRAQDLSEWWGQDIYLAFRHFNSTGNLIVRIDDVRYPTWADEQLNCEVSVNETASQNFIAYPNPFSDELVIEFQNKDFSGVLDVKIFNTLGEIILIKQISGSPTEIDTSTLSQGMYVLEVSCGDVVLRQSLVKD